MPFPAGVKSTNTMHVILPPPPSGGERPEIAPPPSYPLPPPPAEEAASPLLAPLLPPPPVLPPPQPLPEGRDAKGRFAAGNPGRQPGTRHRTTVAIEALLEGQWEGLTKTAVALALRGDTTALRLCFDRIAPARRGTHVHIPDFPVVTGVADVPKAHAALVAAVAVGHLTADEAKPLSDMLSAYVNAVDIVDTAAEVAEIKRMQEEASAKGRY
jgi:hypothetical protein